MKHAGFENTQIELVKFTKNIQNSKTNIAKNSVLENLVTSVVGSEFCSIWIYDESRSILVRKRDSTHLRELSTNIHKGVIYNSFMTKESRVYNNLTTEIEYVDTIDNPDGIKIKSKIILPLIDENRLIGIATAYSSVESMKNFTRYDFNLFKTISPYIINTLYEMKEYKGYERRKRVRQNGEEVISKVQELEAKEQSREEPSELMSYVSNIVHDIRTPANSLYGFLDLLEEKIEDPRLREYVSNAKESASFINDLTTSILDKASNKVVETKSDTQIVNSAVFFSKISELFVSNMYKKKISFNVFIDPLMPREIKVEPLKLKRIIMNLIGNAYKFTPTNECIEFSVRYKKKDKKIHIFVKDSGIGIAKEKQVEIFEAFKQAEDDTNTKYGGHGLGLAICAGYVKELGGKLNIESALDEGSTFYFDIPIDAELEESIFKPLKAEDIKIAIFMESAHSCSSNNIARYLVRMGVDKTDIQAVKNLHKIDKETTHLITFQSKLNAETDSFCKENKIPILVVEEELFSIDTDRGINSTLVISQYGYFADTLYSFIELKSIPRVLVVDDNYISISLLKNILSGEHCEIDTASSGEVALELLTNSIKSQRPYSVVYLDNYMYMMSGDELVNRLRYMEKVSAVKSAYVVSISGDVNEKNSNYDVYSGKPFEKDEIRDIFYTAIDRF